MGGNGNRHATAHPNGHFLVEIKRHGQNKLIARIGHGQDRIQKSHVAARCDHQHGVGAQLHMVFLCQFVLNGFDQARMSADP